MNKTDFENGFALGFTSGGTNLLDHCVTFKANDEDYQIISVKNGNAVNAPVAEPADDGYNFIGWQHDGEIIEFPFIPTEDVEFVVSERAWSDILYEYYKIDREAYPYVLIEYAYEKSLANEVWFTARVFFTPKITKCKSETESNAYYIQLNTYMRHYEDTFSAHCDVESNQVNIDSICNDVMEHATTVSYLYNSSITVTGGSPTTGEFKDGLDVFWVTNDTTWKNVKPTATAVFIIA